MSMIDDTALALGVSRWQAAVIVWWFALAIAVVLGLAVANVVATERLIKKVESAAIQRTET